MKLVPAYHHYCTKRHKKHTRNEQNKTVLRDYFHEVRNSYKSSFFSIIKRNDEFTSHAGFFLQSSNLFVLMRHSCFHLSRAVQ